MNDKIIECKICNSKMKEYESNNPQPLLPDSNDRVCIDCDDYVMASRLILMGIKPHNLEVIGYYIVQIMGMASTLKRSREMSIKLMEEK